MSVLEGKTALIYGGSGAVGGAVARSFAAQGARVVLAARGRERLQRMAAGVTATAANATGGGQMD